MNHYLEVPFYRDLTKVDGWEDIDDQSVRYQVVRAFFQLVTSHMPGSSKLGRKFDVLGAPAGVEQERLKVIELDTEIFNEQETVAKSIVESSSMSKVVSSLALKFGDGKIFDVGGQASDELCSSIKATFQNDFKITNSTKVKKSIRYEFRDTVTKDCDARICGAAVYQRCRADMYLLRVDFLNIEYKRSLMGLRKKLVKSPFPENKKRKKVNEHPNIIKIGVPVAEIQYWELLPKSSLLIADASYVQEVDESEILLLPPREELKNRRYWGQDTPTLYQLAAVAFPYKWVNKPNRELTREELMEIEFGEAEHSGWWHEYGPGRAK